MPTFNQIRSQISATIIDNVTGEISALDMRNVLGLQVDKSEENDNARAQGDAALSDEIVVQKNTRDRIFRDGTPIWLRNVAGTADAITADLPPDLVASPVGIIASAYMILVPTATNVNANPTLSINGGDPKQLFATPAGYLKPGHMYIIDSRSNNYWNVRHGFVDQVDLDSLDQSIADLEENKATVAALEQTTNTSIAYVVQQDGSIPSRPNRSIVYWHCWDDPTSFMKGVDVWYQLPYPVTPGAPNPDVWDAVSKGDGDAIALRLNYLPQEVPAYTDVEFLINGGTTVDGQFVEGYTFATGYAAGSTYDVQMRFRNYLGWGEWSAIKQVTVDAVNSRNDNFDSYPESTSIHGDRWNVVTRSFLDVVTSDSSDPLPLGQVKASGAGWGTAGRGGGARAVHRGYFPDRQYAACDILAMTSNADYGPGVVLQADHTDNQTYIVVATPNGFRIYKRPVDGELVYMTTIGSTLTAPFRMRAEYNEELGRIRVLVDGTIDSEWIDTESPLTGGSPGVKVSHPNSTGAAGASLDNFTAGTF